MDALVQAFQDVAGSVDCSTLTRILRGVNCTFTEEECNAIYQGASCEGGVSLDNLRSYLDKNQTTKFRVEHRGKAVFFDMIHSNNAARIRLWLRHKPGMEDFVETKMLRYEDLKTEEFTRINPLQKVPGLVRADGVTVFESSVILMYLEEKYRDVGPTFVPSNPEARCHMDLITRCHDLYVASPNCTAPGFSHCQGAMYLSFGHHGAARGMDLKTRAAKIAELWKQLSWLNGNIVGPYLVGDSVTHADFTWFPTTIFMEFMLPLVFGWDNIFSEKTSQLPELAKWWTFVSKLAPFAQVRQDILGFWEDMEKKGQFKHIIDEVQADTSGLKFKYP